MMEFFRLLAQPDFYVSIVELSIPLVLAGMAALITNKAGILNIGIEGNMLISALIGTIIGFQFQSPILGVLGAILTGCLFGLSFSFFANKLKVNHILVGIAFNLLAAGLVVFIIFAITGTKGDYPSIQVPRLHIPILSDIPFFGQILFSQNILVYVTILLVLLMHWLIHKTKLGLRIRAVGENPAAVQSVGINPTTIKTYALTIGGALAGLGGAFMSLGFMSVFNTGMIAGRGFIGIAAESIGGGSIFNTVIAAVIFGFVNAIANTSQVSLNIPYELVNTLPYIVTIIGMIIYTINRNRHLGGKQDGEKGLGKRIQNIKN